MGIIKAIYFLVRAFFVCRLSLAAENLALRQQMAVYKHSVKRPKLRPRDRVFWVWLSRLWSNWRSALAIVLLVVDELGYISLDKVGAEHLFGCFSQCYERTSLIVTTNLPFAEWPQIFTGDERLAGALINRLTHRVHVVEIEGDSYRPWPSPTPQSLTPHRLRSIVAVELGSAPTAEPFAASVP